MNSYYFKIDSDVGKELYCSFNAESEGRARRNLLFCCYSHLYKSEFASLSTAGERYELLLNEAHRVKSVTKEEYDTYYPLQLD